MRFEEGELGTRRQTEKDRFWSSQTRGELVPYGGGGARDGGQMNKTA